MASSLSHQHSASFFGGGTGPDSSPTTTALAGRRSTKVGAFQKHVLSAQQQTTARFSRIRSTSLSPYEQDMATHVWGMYVGPSGFVQDEAMLKQLLLTVQLPAIALLEEVAMIRFHGKTTTFSFMDFCDLLEVCKTIHCRWLTKVRGHPLDDDLLEAFVAVGGKEDSSGMVDLDQLRQVVSEFHLDVDLDKIVREMDSDGSAQIEFHEFADLLRDEGGGAKATRRPGDDDEAAGGAALLSAVAPSVLGGSPKTKAKGGYTLSRQIMLDEQTDLADLSYQSAASPTGTGGRTPMDASLLAAEKSRGGFTLERSGSMGGSGRTPQVAQGFPTPPKAQGLAIGRQTPQPGSLPGRTPQPAASFLLPEGGTLAPLLPLAMPIFKGSGGLRAGGPHGGSTHVGSSSGHSSKRTVGGGRSPSPTGGASSVTKLPPIGGRASPALPGNSSKKPAKHKYYNG